MSGEWRLLLAAVQFLTRVPTPHGGDLPPDWLARSGKYFPLVGALVGGLSALTLLGAHAVWRTGPLPVLLALAVGLLATGGLHEDGLADTADGLGGGRSPEQRLAIMKDPRLGTYGALALGGALALKAAALSALPVGSAAAGLVCAHIGARAAAVWAMSLLPYAADTAASKITTSGRTLRPWALGLTLAMGLAPCLLLAPPLGLACAAASTLASCGLAYASARKVGGHTGDVLGAVEQTYELVFLLALSAFDAAGGLVR